MRVTRSKRIRCRKAKAKRRFFWSQFNEEHMNNAKMATAINKTTKKQSEVVCLASCKLKRVHRWTFAKLQDAARHLSCHCSNRGDLSTVFRETVIMIAQQLFRG